MMELDLSIVIPVYNERENLENLLTELEAALKSIPWRYEILCVDDASADGGFELLVKLRQTTRNLLVLRLRQHAGQTSALAAGFDAAQGRVIVTLDADLQNDPKDIQGLVRKLEEGYDIVSGWRRHRQDPWLRRFLSQGANRFLAQLTGIPLRDFGCTLKAYRRDLLKEIVPYGEMHRILPAYLAALGGRIGEMEVHHRPRVRGRSKYGSGRIFRVLLDIVAVSFVLRFSRTPIRAFGGVGLLLVSWGLAVAICVAIRAVFLDGIWISPLIFVATILVLGGIQFVALGLLGEMLLWTQATHPRSRTYVMESQQEEVPRHAKN